MNNELNFSEKELEKAIRSLNSKAPDVYGLTAEHLKYGGSTLVNYLTELHVIETLNICLLPEVLLFLCNFLPHFFYPFRLNTGDNIPNLIRSGVLSALQVLFRSSVR
jgi:hypothetical protein